jgi:2-polyprenyl-3-methyl-5-hydroxy-6-metoxy-1,4-benzoquinol methylase
MDEVFCRIFKKKRWRGNRSVSGPGSDPEQTQVLIASLPALFRDLEIKSILDVPCGDFLWMRDVDLNAIRYTGADIVEEIIQHNKEAYQRQHVRFLRLNLVQDELPQVDLMLCRDGLVHLSFEDVFKSLNNMCKSKSRYLLATTFTDREINQDILSGQWRTLNLERPPFNLCRPMSVINEECPHRNGIYADKSLGLWRMDDVRVCLGS